MKTSTLLAHQAFLGCCSAAVHSIQLTRLPLSEQLDALKPGYISLQNQQPITRSHNQHDVPLRNHRNAQYYTDINIGTDEKTYKVIIDTSYPSILMTTSSNEAPDSVMSPGQDSHETKPKSREGNISIGDIKIEHQKYGEITGNIFGNLDGLFGLAYLYPDSPISNMIEQELIDEPLFAISLGDAAKNEPSTLTLGGVDQNHFTGEITYLPTSRKGLWELQLDSLTFDDEVVDLENTTAALDSATSLLTLPSTVADLLNQQIGVKADATVDCAKRRSSPDLKFTMAGREFALAAEDYILEKSEGDCVSAVTAFDYELPSGPLAILGSPFLRKWYSVYSVGNNTIGLAKAV